MQDIIKPMISVMNLVKLKITWPTKNCLMMSLNESCEEYFWLKYTNFTLTNDSVLDKEEKK